MTPKATGVTVRAPKRPNALAPSGATIITRAAEGMRAKPALSTGYPSTNCRYCVTAKEMPKVKKYCMATTRQPTENFGSRKNRTFMSGCSTWSSQRQNPKRTAPEPARPATTGRLPHPRSGPSMREATSPAEKRIDSTTPSQSIGTRTCTAELGTTSQTATITTAQTGTFTANSAPHQKWVSRNPAVTGAATAAADAVAAHTPMARRRVASVV